MADTPAAPPPVLRFPPPRDISGLREAFPDATIYTGKAAARHLNKVLAASFDEHVARLQTLVDPIREAEGGDNLVTDFAYAAARETARTGDFRFLGCAVAAVEAWTKAAADNATPADEDPFSE